MYDKECITYKDHHGSTFCKVGRLRYIYIKKNIYIYINNWILTFIIGNLEFLLKKFLFFLSICLANSYKDLFIPVVILINVLTRSCYDTNHLTFSSYGYKCLKNNYCVTLSREDFKNR